MSGISLIALGGIAVILIFFIGKFMLKYLELEQDANKRIRCLRWVIITFSVIAIAVISIIVFPSITRCLKSSVPPPAVNIGQDNSSLNILGITLALLGISMSLVAQGLAGQAGSNKSILLYLWAGAIFALALIWNFRYEPITSMTGNPWCMLIFVVILFIVVICLIIFFNRTNLGSKNNSTK